MMQIIRNIKGMFSRPPNVEKYWTRHVVNARIFASPSESLDYLNTRFELYPFFKEYMNLYQGVENKVVMDYGCGPGDDVVGFAIKGKVRKVIGVDVSTRALKLAQEKIELHKINKNQVQLVHASDTTPQIPLESNSIDHIYSQGVLHHTSFPQEILNEFFRVLKPGGTGRIMVYNKDSLWLHLFTAYIRIIEQGQFAGKNAFEAFQMNTDGKDCPISRCYNSDEFLTMLKGAGFQAKYLGGYYSSDAELDVFREKYEAALASPELPTIHKEFLAKVKIDQAGYPHINGIYIGIGGSYEIWK